MSTPTKRVAFHTLGCKLNFSETATISRDFISHGFEKVDYRDEADIYILNTCSVTENADKEARKLIRQAKRRNPDSSLAVIGCYAQLKPNDIAAITGVDMVLGAEEKFNLFNHLFSGVYFLSARSVNLVYLASKWICIVPYNSFPKSIVLIYFY